MTKTKVDYDYDLDKDWAKTLQVSEDPAFLWLTLDKKIPSPRRISICILETISSLIFFAGTGCNQGQVLPKYSLLQLECNLNLIGGVWCFPKIPSKTVIWSTISQDSDFVPRFRPRACRWMLSNEIYANRDRPRRTSNDHSRWFHACVVKSCGLSPKVRHTLPKKCFSRFNDCFWKQAVNRFYWIATSFRNLFLAYFSPVLKLICQESNCEIEGWKWN